jgi:hypothetical protein
MTDTRVRSRSLSPKRTSPIRNTDKPLEIINFADISHHVGISSEVAKHMDAYRWCVGYAPLHELRYYLFLGLIEQLQSMSELQTNWLSDGLRAVRFGKTPVTFGQSAFLTYLFEFQDHPQYTKELLKIERACETDIFGDWIACDRDVKESVRRKTYVHGFKRVIKHNRAYMMFDLELPLPCADTIDHERWPSIYWTDVKHFRERFALPIWTPLPCMCDCPLCSPGEWGAPRNIK